VSTLAPWLVLLSLATPAEPRPSVRVVSYNTWLFPHVSEDFAGRRDRMGPALAALEPDVLCLQEVWDRGAALTLRGHLRGRLPHARVSGGGLMVLSRWPIVDAAFEPHPVHARLSLAERLAKKGALHVLIDTPFGPLHVVDTHLAHERDGARDGHALQVAALIERLGSRAAPGTPPMIVCGDLNFRAVRDGAPSRDFAALRALGFEDAAGTGPDADGRWHRRRPTRVGRPRTPEHRRENDPDYVLVRGGAGVELAVRSFRLALDSAEEALSDHEAIVVDLDVSAARDR